MKWNPVPIREKVILFPAVYKEMIGATVWDHLTVASKPETV
jgi:hypothetical protein